MNGKKVPFIIKKDRTVFELSNTNFDPNIENIVRIV